MYKADYSAVLYCAAKDFYEFAMTYRIEEAFKVKVYYIYVAVIDYTLSSSKRIMATFPRTEAIARLRELVLIDWGQRLADGLLHQTVYYRWDAQKAQIAVVLGHLCPLDWVWAVCAARQGTHEFILIGP